MQTKAYAEIVKSSPRVLDDDALLTSAQIKALCGDVSDMCIWRWMRDKRVEFPQPIKINRRNYWRRRAFRDWQEKHATKTAA